MITMLLDSWAAYHRNTKMIAGMAADITIGKEPEKLASTPSCLDAVG